MSHHEAAELRAPRALTVLVIAKEPVPGRVKTRLMPTLTAEQAAEIARACLEDTLAMVASAPAARRILVLDGQPGPWLPAGFEVIPQVEGGLGDRLAAAFRAVDGPAFVIGMDTPHLTPADLWPTFAEVGEPDAAYGPASDGGYWGLGMRHPAPSVFDGVPMSQPHTGAVQLERLTSVFGPPTMLPERRDLDTVADIEALVKAFPHLRLARTWDRITGALERQPTLATS